MKKYLLLVLLITMLLLMSACGGEQRSASGHASGTEDVKTEGSDDDQDEEEKMLRMYIGDTEVSVEWQDNRSVDALKELCKDEPQQQKGLALRLKQKLQKTDKGGKNGEK